MKNKNVFQILNVKNEIKYKIKLIIKLIINKYF